MSKKKKQSRGRPRKVEVPEVPVTNEDNVNVLSMEQKEVTLEEVTSKWEKTLKKTDYKSQQMSFAELTTTITNWNKLNPFLQNQRLKMLMTQSKSFDKTKIPEFLNNPGAFEPQLRGLSWSQSSSQQIYYNVLRRSADIPQYKYFVVPDLLDSDRYEAEDFKNEDRLVHEWLEMFNIPNSLKTIALQVKREGKQSYLLRNRISGTGKDKKPVFCALEKMPSDWIKIVGIGQLGYTISFNMMYFMNIANSPSDFGEFMELAWKEMVDQGVIQIKDNKRKFGGADAARRFNFSYLGETYTGILERIRDNNEYLFWIRLPYDICYTIGSDNSHPWAAPDTMGLLQKLQELSDYAQLAGLIASTPLSAVLTGEIETISNARAGKNESVFNPEIIQGYQDMFNAVTSTNVEAWIWPAKNIKLQQLSSDVNASDIISAATENFVESAGEGGLTITTSKPNVSQVKTAQLLAASQQRYVTLQMEQIINFILQNKLGLKYRWKIRIWGDIFSFENERKYIKELVAGGAMFLLPKLCSAEDISMRDTKAMVGYIKSLDFYKYLSTFTMENEVKNKGEKVDTSSQSSDGPGRKPLDDSDIENDATAASRDRGDNTADNRETLSKKDHVCPICGADIDEDQYICDECLTTLYEERVGEVDDKE